MLNWLSQVFLLTAVNLRTIRTRRGSTASAVIGIALVVAVLLLVLSIAEGFLATMTGTSSPETAIVLRSGSDSEMSSVMNHEMADIVALAPGIRKETDGPDASAELFVVVDVPKRSTGTDANVPLRGVQPSAPRARPSFRIIEGRMFGQGRNEVIVGLAAERQFAGLEIGRTLRWGQSEWTVAGVFTTGGSVEDTEIWCDARVLQPAYRRGDTFQSVRVRLESSDSFQKFKDALTTDPRLDVEAHRESEYFAEQSEVLVAVVRALGWPIALLMAVGAAFGALNTMYNAVASRTREIATLRALGFRAGPVVLSVLAESLTLAFIGGVTGGVISWAAFDGFQTSTLNWQGFSQVAFAFRVTPRLLAQGIVLALLVGLVGGLFPAIRAARSTVASALREL